MDTNYYKQYEPIFGSWYIKELLGIGRYGKVYRIERNDIGGSFEAALKIITIPASQSEVEFLIAEGMNGTDITQYYKTVMKKIVNQFVILEKLKGNSNIVSYEDHDIIVRTDNMGWDILIKMELLTPLTTYIDKNKITKRDVVNLGIDICKALELCQKNNIVHRDIKPENIFISANGDYKLGDFGTSRTIEEATQTMSGGGTFAYMTPEVFKGEKCDSTVDIYSLGIVMYKLLNENRLPFLPEYPKPIAPIDKEEVLHKRLKGTDIPEPKNGSRRLRQIVLKACAYNPEERYSSASYMRKDLEAVLNEKNAEEIVFPDGDDVVIERSESRNVSDDISDEPFCVLPAYFPEGDKPEEEPYKATGRNEKGREIAIL